ncbi:DegT/DnrJ/EryC1/StrS family aminotransferase [Methyloceanibacter sp.]|uniref:DegT/DnrJ/EryC1/StrS family aminotransferase n=1 Tax=Methyloceanibacter sp. TaxID=1965321 RepID=UPI003D6D76B2
MIPLQQPCVGAAELAAVGQVFELRWLGMGAETRQFEQALENLLNVKHVIAVNTGTSALHLALAALDLLSGDEVIVPSLTFVASPQAILAAGGTPVFCEIDPQTLNLDLTDVAACITPRTRAIMPVHYGGVPSDMRPLLAMAKEHGLRVIEDAAHAFGSRYEGQLIGSFGDVTCFSFDPIKNITCGEGGAIATNDLALAERVKIARILGISNHTWNRLHQERSWAYEVGSPGFRYHLSNINAAIGLIQLGRAHEFRERKQALVRRYEQLLPRHELIRLVTRASDDVFPFFYVIRVLGSHRDEMMRRLKARGIDTGIHYIPNHLQPLFRANQRALPVTERAFGEILTLPLFVEMADDQVQRVAEEIANALDELRSAPAALPAALS